jgi:hypothetical protein
LEIYIFLLFLAEIYFIINFSRKYEDFIIFPLFMSNLMEEIYFPLFLVGKFVERICGNILVLTIFSLEICLRLIYLRREILLIFID